MLTATLSAGLAFALYVWTAAPDITWAHQGADGAELLAAAVSNGVPHPPGYPLYMWLLQGWLRFSQLGLGHSDLAWRGALLSTVCAAVSVGITVWIAGHLLQSHPGQWLWATGAGLAWAISPLLWSQAVITEVYALHALLVALLGWVILVKGGRFVYLIPIVALGVAHHLTFILLLPAVLYFVWVSRGGTMRQLGYTVGALALGGILGFAFYLRIPLVAAGGVAGPPPVDWGYADNLAGFWWLISGAAYRSYLFSAPSSTMLSRVASWAYTLTNQYTVVGLGLALIGLNQWDRNKPDLRNLSLLWVVPISIYAIGYYTRDSDIYLLPVGWMMALWLATGLADAHNWLQIRWSARSMPTIAAIVLAMGLLVLGIIRLPMLSLRQDREARQFLDSSIAVLPPNSIVISREDNDTFALWYGAWASGELLHQTPNVVLINDSLYQFPWYQRLITALYPDVVGNSQSVAEILAANHGVHPIFFSTETSLVPAEQLEKVGSLWRYK
ncbi:DUF2723 domain-containing protein [soil metagenome]